MALAPVLAIASVNAVVIASASTHERRARLMLSADYAMRDVESALNNAEIVLALFKPDIEAGACKRVFDEIKPLISPLSNIARFDANGIATCSALGEPGYRIAQIGWYEKLRGAQAVLRTESFFGEKSKDWLFAILSRSVAEDGGFDGVVSMGLRADGLADLIDRTALPEGVEVSVVGKNGRVYGSERFRAVPEEWITQASSVAYTPLFHFKDDNEGEIDLAIRPIAATDVFVAISGRAPGLWSEIKLRPLTTIGLPLLAFAIALATVWMGIDRLVLQWLARLERVARVYGAGRYSLDAASTIENAPDEIVRLATAMGSMARNIAERDEDLRSALAFRDTAVKEIHHRIKNNLQIVTSFLSLQARQLKDEGGRAVLANAQNRISALAVVHQTLYQTDRMTDVDLASFLRLLMEHLAEALGLADDRITLNQSYDAATRPADDAIPIALFLVEAVTNAAKYAYGPDGGTITVALTVTPDHVTILVEDSGRGYVPDAAPTGDGLGSRLMKSFARQLGADIRIETAAGQGTSCRLILPLVSRHKA